MYRFIACLGFLVKGACLCVFGISFSSCLRPSKPNLPTPVELPQSWQTQLPLKPDSPVEPWLAKLNSTDLSSIVSEALTHNHDLSATAARLDAAWWRQFSSRSRTFPNASFRSSTRRSAGESRPGTLRSQVSYSTSLDISWELDLWGRLRRQNRADLSLWHSSSWDLRGAKLSLAARTAQAWADLFTAQRQAALAQQQLETLQQDKDLILRSYELGLDASAADLNLAENQIELAQNRLLQRQQNVRNASRTLEVLLGRYPEAKLQANTTKLPAWDQEIPYSVPVELLARRPDVVSAQLTVLARLDQAEAEQLNWLPDISLSLGAGRTASRVADLFDIKTLSRQIGSSLAQPLLDGGNLAGQRKASRQEAKAAIEEYAEVLLQAMLEVENTLDLDHVLAQQEQLLRNAFHYAEQANSLAQQDFASGLASSTQLFETQRRLIESQIALLDIQNQRWQNRLLYYLAIGGPP